MSCELNNEFAVQETFLSADKAVTYGASILEQAFDDVRQELLTVHASKFTAWPEVDF